MGRGFDCNDRWALRTALYEAGQAGTAGSGGPAAGAARAPAAVVGGDGAAAARSAWGSAAGGHTLDMEQVGRGGRGEAEKGDGMAGKREPGGP